MKIGTVFPEFTQGSLTSVTSGSTRGTLYIVQGGLTGVAPRPVLVGTVNNVDSCIRVLIGAGWISVPSTSGSEILLT